MPSSFIGDALADSNGKHECAPSAAARSTARLALLRRKFKHRAVGTERLAVLGCAKEISGCIQSDAGNGQSLEETT